MKVVPKCLLPSKKDKKPPAYTSDGYILPCCWLDSKNAEKDINFYFLKDEELKLENNNSVKDIIASDIWTDFFNSLKDPNQYNFLPKICRTKCTSNEDTEILDNYYHEYAYADAINIDTSHRCELQCPQCHRQSKGANKKIKKSYDMPIENLNKIVNFYNHKINYCGQISDPIYHPNFLELLKLSIEKCDEIRVSTNGSNKPEEWWDEIFKHGIGKVLWWFGVDGIDKKSEIYRVGSTFESSWNAMKKGRKMGHIIIWQYIVFGYNENDIEKAIQIAKEEDFNLVLIKSDRDFDVKSRRKNVNMVQLGTPKEQYISKVIKEQEFVYMTNDYKKLLKREKYNNGL